MKHISINLSEEISKVLPDTLEKDLQDNEAICPTCSGLGIVAFHNRYGIEGDISEIAKKFRLPYDRQALSFCPDCFNGVIKLCEYCGKPFRKGWLACDCEHYQEQKRQEKATKYQETIAKAKAVDIKSVTTYLYDEETDNYFPDDGEFAEYYWQRYFDNKSDYHSFDEYFEQKVPSVLWVCSESSISINVYDTVENACEELHEEAMDSIGSKDMKDLQTMIDDWCGKQTGTLTYYPCYKEYVRVDRKWFD